jgi:predicted NBD/HSP70 family sugar kinase
VAESVASSSEIRKRNLRLVLDTLRTRRTASRSDIAGHTGLSKPTVGAALRSFETAGIVREYGRTTGRRGPGASLYEVVADAVLVLGIDVGAHYLRTELSDLNGERVEELTERLAHPTAADVVAGLRAVARRTGPSMARVELAVLGSPGIIDPGTGVISAAPNIEGWDGVIVGQLAGDALGVPMIVDNDVNLAALGERRAGAGAAIDSFAYLSIGSGLGSGIVLHGRLHRGARGAAGEIGFLPVGDDPFAASGPGGGGAMEGQLSSRALTDLAERLSTSTPTTAARPFDVHALFDAARTGDALGRAIVDYTARATAICIAGLTSVADLELVLLGGGIGQNAGLLLHDIRDATAALVPAPPRIACATLGDRAVTVGAVGLGLDLALERIVDRLVQDEPAVANAARP